MGWIYAIGFLAQLFFSARIVIQWVLSERAHRIVSPSAYWICSLAGSWLLFLYGWLREDFAIILGQLISYYVYLWNLNIKGIYGKIPRLARFVLVATPVAALAAIAGVMRTHSSIPFSGTSRCRLHCLSSGLSDKPSSRCASFINGSIPPGTGNRVFPSDSG